TFDIDVFDAVIGCRRGLAAALAFEKDDQAGGFERRRPLRDDHAARVDELLLLLEIVELSGVDVERILGGGARQNATRTAGGACGRRRDEGGEEKNEDVTAHLFLGGCARRLRGRFALTV